MLVRPVIEEKSEDGTPIRKLFIGNLAIRTTCDDLRETLSGYGEIESCFVKHNKVGNSQFAFVTFNNASDAARVRSETVWGISLHNRTLHVVAANPWHQPDRVQNKKYSYNNFEDNGLIEIDYIKSPIQMLDDDSLTEIFLYLPIADRIRSERVCRRWRSIGQKSWRTVKSLDMSPSTWGITSSSRFKYVDENSLWKILTRCGQYLTNLDFSLLHLTLSQSILTMVAKLCPNLQCINVRKLRLLPSGIYSLMRCRTISKLIMEPHVASCEKDLSQLFHVIKELKYLAIYGETTMIGKCLMFLPNTIEEIHLHECISLRSKNFNFSLEKFIHIHTLTLDTCVCLDDTTLQSIGEMQTIINFALTGSCPLISANAMNHLASLVNLQQLNVMHNSAVTDNFLINISNNCKSLRILDISHCQAVTDKGVISMMNLNKLEILKINCISEVTDGSIGQLNSLQLLECRDGKNIRDQGIIKLIETASNLKTLDLSGCCSITNDSIKTAIAVTAQRINNLKLTIYIKNTNTDLSKLNPDNTLVWPFLQIIGEEN